MGMADRRWAPASEANDNFVSAESPDNKDVFNLMCGDRMKEVKHPLGIR
jgi:hypothetical protein